MTESILNLGTRLIDDGFDEFIMITADPHVLSRKSHLIKWDIDIINVK